MTEIGALPPPADPASEAGKQALHWRGLALACLSNGGDLLADAELLLRHGRHPRAFSLAVLSIEEYGKACQALAVINSGGAPEAVEDYDRLSPRHGQKISLALLFHSFIDPGEDFSDDFPERLDLLVHDAASRKMRGFYVDRVVGGLATPSDVDESEAEQAIQVGRTLGGQLAKRLTPLESEDFVLQLWSLGPLLKAEMEREIETNGATPAQSMVAIREVLTHLDAGDFQPTEEPEPLHVPGEVADFPQAASADTPMQFLGVDLAWADGEGLRLANETGLVLLAGDGTVLEAGWTRGVKETLNWIDEHVSGTDVLAFVDAPLVVSNATGQRLCETQVGQRYGRWKVLANSTNVDSKNSAGLSLLQQLELRGWTYDDGHDGPPAHGLHVSECYPYTTLVGVAELGYDDERPRYKRAPPGLPAARWKPQRAATCDDLIQRMRRLSEFDPPLRLDSHPVTTLLLQEPSPLDDATYKHREDLLDAALCAWTASLWHRRSTVRCQVLGQPRGEDMIRVATIVAPAVSAQRRSDQTTAVG